MLCLTRLLGERVILILPDGREITVGVDKLNSRKVRLAIEAPKDVQIQREENLYGDAARHMPERYA